MQEYPYDSNYSNRGHNYIFHPPAPRILDIHHLLPQCIIYCPGYLPPSMTDLASCIPTSTLTMHLASLTHFTWRLTPPSHPSTPVAPHSPPLSLSLIVDSIFPTEVVLHEDGKRLDEVDGGLLLDNAPHLLLLLGHVRVGESI